MEQHIRIIELALRWPPDPRHNHPLSWLARQAPICFPSSCHCSVKALQRLLVSPRPNPESLTWQTRSSETSPLLLPTLSLLDFSSYHLCLLSLFRPPCPPCSSYLPSAPWHQGLGSLSSLCLRFSLAQVSTSLALTCFSLGQKNVFIWEALLTSLYKDNIRTILYTLNSALFSLKQLITLYIYGGLFMAISALCPPSYCLACSRWSINKAH